MKPDIKLFEPISIIGRIAYAITCIENVASSQGNANPLITSVIKVLWEFTNTEDAATWQEKVDLLSPEYILNYDVEAAFLQQGIGINFQELLNEYRESDTRLLNMIDNTILIGVSGLYCSLGKSGEEQLIYLEYVLKTYALFSIPFPKLNHFAESKFSERFGWGNPQNPSFFKK